MRRVVITGVGVVSPVGIGRDSFWSNLTAGRSGTGLLSLFDASAFPVRLGAEVKDFDAAAVRRRFPETDGVRDRKVLLAMVAAEEAITDAGLPPESLQDGLLYVATGLEYFSLEEFAPFANRPDMASALAESARDTAGGPMMQTPLDCTSRLLAGRHGFFGGCYTNCSACAAGTQVIGEAWNLLQYGDETVALVGGTDSMLNPLGVGGFGLLRVLSDEHDTPRSACRPFDASRKGTVLGEGSAFLVLESREHAVDRGANIYAEILGYGSSMDAFRVSDPDSSGAGSIISMRAAIRRAGLTPEAVNCISAHGTGTRKNDAIETAAIKEVFEGRAYEIPVHAVKSMTGHMIAASGAVEAVAAALTLTAGEIPPTINLREPDPACDLDYVSEGARRFDGETVLSNSFGFGGQNATLLLGKYHA